MQLELPIPNRVPIPIVYVEMDGMGISVVRKENGGRAGKQGQLAHAREGKLGCAPPRPQWTTQVISIRDEDSTSYVLGGWSRGDRGSGIGRIYIFPLRAKSSISTMLASTCGIYLSNSILAISKTSWTRG
jgi:hypothetical protein